ncbi:MAG: HD domain-containing protein [Armatimonadetes bacterium]|nr:HD domain-containing protein [Armatimonadota bacterium]
MAGKLIRDALHGDISFTTAEMRLIDTPAVQRLRGIKQLGAANLVYPSSVHTRFEHSLGTCWLAKRLLAGLKERGARIDRADEAAVPAAALLHDVTHVPFGHTFEDERRLFERHDRDPERLARILSEPRLAEALRATGCEPRVRELLGPDPVARPVAQEIISGTVCADLLDYLRRDAFHTGLAQGYDDRLFRSFDVVDGHLAVDLQKNGLFRHDVLSELIHLLRVRYNLTERVYYHHAKAVAGAMISKALELALAAERLTVPELCELRDDSLLFLLRERCRDVPGVEMLLDELDSRRLYKRVYLLTLPGYGRVGISFEKQAELAQRYHFDRDERAAAEARLAERLGVPPAAVILYCPSPSMQLKEARVLVRVDGERAVPLDSLRNPEVDSLREKYGALWRFFVCLHREHVDRFAAAGAACEEQFGAENMVALQSRGQLSFDF